MTDIVYCENWKCKDKECLRHHANQPFEIVTRQRMWTPNKSGDCAGKFTKPQK
jgi:hypothetical protein